MAKTPTKAEKSHMESVRALGCIICGGVAAVHHALTGMGGRKNHMKVLPLCWTHHQGPDGIHTLSRKVWQALYGTELELLTKTEGLL